MAEETGIQWTDHTANPWWGCLKVSPGCQYCYADMLSQRLGKNIWGPEATTRREYKKGIWHDLPKWNRKAEAEGVRRRVFVMSMGDFFEEHLDVVRWRVEFMALMEQCAALDFQVLTKRPENVVKMVPESWYLNWPDHIWIGTSVENQEMADRRIPELLKVPARIRFLSCEPLLGPVDLQPWLHMTGIPATVRVGARELPGSFMPFHWVIVGGESGQKARPFYIEWAQDLVKQCDYAGVPVFVKQLGSNPRQRADLKNANWRLDLRDKKGGDMSEWPPELRIRQFPPVEQAR